MSCAASSSATERSRASIRNRTPRPSSRSKRQIDNWRWAGVPFYLRTGKRMAEGQRIISIAFREPPKSMFPSGFRGRLAGTGSSDLRSRRPVEGVAVVLRQAAGSGDAARQAEHAVHDRRDGPRRRRARGLRAAHPRRHARRSHAVLHRRTASSDCGKSRSRCSNRPRRSRSTRPAPGDRSRSIS